MDLNTSGNIWQQVYSNNCEFEYLELILPSSNSRTMSVSDAPKWTEEGNLLGPSSPGGRTNVLDYPAIIKTVMRLLVLVQDGEVGHTATPLHWQGVCHQGIQPANVCHLAPVSLTLVKISLHHLYHHYHHRVCLLRSRVEHQLSGHQLSAGTGKVRPGPNCRPVVVTGRPADGACALGCTVHDTIILVLIH